MTDVRGLSNIVLCIAVLHVPMHDENGVYWRVQRVRATVNRALQMERASVTSATKATSRHRRTHAPVRSLSACCF